MNLLSPRGRINRLTFFLYQIVLICIALIFCILLQPFGISAKNFILFGSLVFGWMFFMLIIKRLHDIGMSGWFLILYGIGITGIVYTLGVEIAFILKNIAILFLYLKKGEEGWNIYGDDPLEKKKHYSISSESKQKIEPKLISTPTVVVESRYDILENQNGEILIIINALEGRIEHPYLVFNNMNLATLYRSENNVVILSNLSSDGQRGLRKVQKVLIVEVKEEDIVREYYADVKMQKEEKIERFPTKINDFKVYVPTFGNLFSPSGRMNRLHFLLYNAALLPFTGTLMDTPLVLLPLWLHIALIIKRLHDMEKSGLIIASGIGMLLLPIVKYSSTRSSALRIVENLENIDTSSWGHVFMSLCVIGLIILGSIEGTIGKNNYGNDPLEELDNE